MRRIILFILICILPLTALSACYDAQEVTEWAYVYSIGMEKGVTDKLRMSVQIQTMKGGAGGGGQTDGGGKTNGEEKDGYVVITIDCPTFYAGVNMINSFLSRELNYMHTKFMVYSENLAKEGIDTYITAFIRGRQIRRDINIIVSKGSASEFLKASTTVVSAELSKKQENLIQQSKNTGFFIDATYGDFISALKTQYNQPVAILAAVNESSTFREGEGTGEVPFKTSGDYYAGGLVRKGGSNVELLGTALFDGGKMVGELNGDETRAMLMARGEFSRGFFAVRDPKKSDTTITVEVRKQRGRNVKVRFEKNKPVIDLKVFLEGDILAIQSTIDYEDKKLKPILENTVKDLIKNQLDRTIQKCQRLNADVFKFGHVAAMSFDTIPQWEGYNWLKQFKDARVNTEVEFKVRRTGTMIKSSEIYTSEGKKGER